ncbi:hypothetical protein pf16_216 [Pseudomonas phage pf16]|uniref:Uncharacterized protein n=1 Tax=Pseudomonas phage pf16 TaxID=1815630 RepID=A0A1S5R403_9CAUD|nr:hypothetical protein FDG98_gp082 [Pseudomonas phage pf16]AND75139.1 hypothetical protein pf16_216 [Pseudomonas phage pf16]
MSTVNVNKIAERTGTNPISVKDIANKVTLAASDGASKIGFGSGTVADELVKIKDTLVTLEANIWNYASLITEKPSLLDPTTWDWTPAFQAAANQGGSLYVPSSTYIISHVQVPKSFFIHAAAGTVFFQKNNTIVAKTHWTPGVGMFELSTDGISFGVDGFWTFDGNSANQVQIEPAGTFVKCMPFNPATNTKPTTIELHNGTFINGSYSYVIARGDALLRRFVTKVHLHNCTMYDTLYGVGKGDPATPSALGFSPTYVMALDYVILTTHNLRMFFEKPVSLGKYAATGVLGTYYGQDYANSGQALIMLEGITYCKGMGRGGVNWDGDPLGLNGIGVIDVYGNGDTLHVEHVVAEDCHVQVIRAKASLNKFHVGKFDLNNCDGGIQVSPSSTGPATTSVYIGPGEATACAVPIVEVTGTTTSDTIQKAVINGVFVKGGTNPNARTAVGSIHVRNVIDVAINDVTVRNCPLYGISAVDITRLSITNPAVRNVVGGVGIWISGGVDIDIKGGTVASATAGAAINMASVTGDIRVDHVKTSGTKDYSILINSASAKSVVIVNCRAETVSDLSRGYYSAVGFDLLAGNKIISGVTTPWVTPAGFRNIIRDNSWDPYLGWGGAAAPTTGTYNRGDILLNQFPTSGTPTGFRCTVAGSPGTWEAFT